MGQTHAVQYNDMVQTYNPFEWRLLEDHRNFEVWQSIQTGKKQSAFPINITQADSQQNVQIYHFRKLNYLHLVSAEAILKHENVVQFCSEPRGVKVLIEYIPVMLSQINKKLGFLERLSILSTIFAGLHTVNYLFGPLYVTQHMVGFTQNGKPKIWINEDFSKNEPSITAKGEITQASGTVELQLLENEMLVAEEMLNCVTQVFKTAGNSDVETYPYDFRVEAANVRTFSEGQELIQSYCRSKGIELMENIPYWEYLKETESEQQGTQNHTLMSMLQHSNQASNPSNHTNLVQSQGYRQLPTQRPKRQPQPVNLQKSTTRWNGQQQSLVSQSVHPNNTKITINYGGQTFRKNQHKQVLTTINMAPPLSSPPPSAVSVAKPAPPIIPPLVFNSNHQHTPSYRTEQNVVRYSVKDEENKSTPVQVMFRLQEKQVPQQQQIFQQPMMIQPSQPVESVQSEHRFMTNPPQPLGNPPMIVGTEQTINFTQRLQQSVVERVSELPSQKSQVVQEYKIEISEVEAPPKNVQNDSSNINVPEQHLIQESHTDNSYNTLDEIKLWQQSLISKLSNRKPSDLQNLPNNQFQYQYQVYESCESQEGSQQVRFGGYESQSSQNIKDMEAYIRNKYKEYLSNSNENNMDSSESDSNGGNEKLYSFGFKASKLTRGRENSLTGLKPNLFRKRSSISEKVPYIQMSKPLQRDHKAGFMPKPNSLGLDSQYKIIQEESARQSGRQSELESKIYRNTFGKIRHKESQYSFNSVVSQREPMDKCQSKREYNSSFGKLEDRYNKYVVNNKRSSVHKQSLNVTQNQVYQLSQSNNNRTYDKYCVDSINESGIDSSFSHKLEYNLRNIMDSPAGSRKGRAGMPKNHLTYDSLRDFLRK